MSRATVAKETRLGELVGIPFSPRMVRNLSAVYPKQKFQPKTLAGFVAFARERLSALSVSEA
jgi:hypothetical protein